MPVSRQIDGFARGLRLARDPADQSSACERDA
jgi:hypothetical protein